MNIESHHLQVIRTHAERCYPQECCGVLLGKRDGGKDYLVEVVPTENSWDEAIGIGDKTKRERYAIAPETLLNLQKSARSRHLKIVGFYHSHPDHPAIPSECDRQLAWPDYHYIIVSVVQGQAKAVNSWVLDGDRTFQPENILNTSPREGRTELQ